MTPHLLSARRFEVLSPQLAATQHAPRPIPHQQPQTKPRDGPFSKTSGKSLPQLKTSEHNAADCTRYFQNGPTFFEPHLIAGDRQVTRHFVIGEVG